MPRQNSSTKNDSSPTFGEIFNLYYKKHAQLKTRRPENARYFYNSHGVKWSNIRVTSIKKQEVQRWVDEIGNTSGHAVANRAVNLMAAIINWSMKRGYLVQMENPCRYVERFKVKSRERFLQPAEIKLLSLALDEEPPLIHDFFWMCLWTGARRGNVQSMRWEDTDFDLSVWRIPVTKNDESHYTPLSGAEIKLLRKRKLLTGKSKYVFPSKGRSGFLSDPRRAWERIKERAGLNDLRIHDLRRTKGAYLAMQGTDGFLIAKALGHKDLRSTSVYARMNLVAVRRAIELVHTEWQTIIGELRTEDAKPIEHKTLKLRMNRDDSQAIHYQRPKNASVRIIGNDQERVERKILTALTERTLNKAGLYKKIGGLQVNALELERILEEMITRKQIHKYRDDRHLHSWQYELTTEQSPKRSRLSTRTRTV